MTKKLIERLAPLKPRNVFAPLASRRAAGAHAGDRRRANDEKKDLLQRLREAGL
jgi:hypothetical protein